MAQVVHRRQARCARLGEAAGRDCQSRPGFRSAWNRRRDRRRDTAAAAHRGRAVRPLSCCAPSRGIAGSTRTGRRRRTPGPRAAQRSNRRPLRGRAPTSRGAPRLRCTTECSTAASGAASSVFTGTSASRVARRRSGRPTCRVRCSARRPILERHGFHRSTGASAGTRASAGECAATVPGPRARPASPCLLATQAVTGSSSMGI